MVQPGLPPAPPRHGRNRRHIGAAGHPALRASENIEAGLRCLFTADASLGFVDRGQWLET
jgi:hypothetical protein